MLTRLATLGIIPAQLLDSGAGLTLRVKRMDVLADIVSTTHVSSSVFRHHELVAPWVLEYPASISAGFVVVLEGSTWLTAAGDVEPILLAPYEMVLLPHGKGHRIVSSLTNEQYRDHDLLRADSGLVEGDLPRARVVCGCYTFERDGLHPLLAMLPRQIRVTAPEAEQCLLLSSFIKILINEVRDGELGSEAIVSRLTDVIFIKIVRRWAESQPGSDLSWIDALRDSVVGPALVAIHQEPGREWDLDSLSGEVGMSRAAFSRRFRRLVGEPPLTYLTRWRMDFAARLLRESECPLAQIAQRIGYTSEYAFNRAFQRVRGVPPGRYRQRSRQRASTHH